MMKRNYLIIIICIVLSISSFKAQYNQWAFMKGDTTANPQTYGTTGVIDVRNVPGALPSFGGAGSMAQWTDKQGNFWLIENTFAFILATRYSMWKYEPSTNIWYLMKNISFTGFAGIASGVEYGSKGVFSTTSLPGVQSDFSCATWVDTLGYLWLFGGRYGGSINGYSDNLWKFDPDPSRPTHNQWAWVNGGGNTVNIPANYGLQGVPSYSNTPGGRMVECSWVDKNGELWLFGGNKPGGFILDAPNYYNDLWKINPYETNTEYNKWVWVSGSTSSNISITYGVKGVENASNNPGSRNVYARWYDKDSDALWFYGGFRQLLGNTNLDSSFAYYTDVWKYSISTSNWTWMSGTTGKRDPGSYGTQCAADSLNYPTGRRENEIQWTDQCGNLWMFGGDNNYEIANTNVEDPYYNDLWHFNKTTNLWTWVRNSYQERTVFGSKGVASASSKPGSRTGFASFQNKSGVEDRFWVYGGSVFNSAGSSFQPSFNDLWQYYPDKPRPGFSYDFASCMNASIAGIDSSCNIPKNIRWTVNDPNSNSTTYDGLSINHQFSTPGTYSVKLNMVSCTGTIDSAQNNVVVPFLPSIFIASSDTAISEGDSLLISTTSNSAVGSNYLWSPTDGLSCVNCANPTARPSITTTYVVSYTDQYGCSDADTIKVRVVSPDNAFTDVANIFSPNNDGVNDEFSFPSLKASKSFICKVYNRWGNLIYEWNNPSLGWDAQNVVEGTYYYAVSAEIKSQGNYVKVSNKGYMQVIKD